MATEAQIAANRLNAEKSTGPRTPEGKAVSAQNSLKHGLFAREGVIRGEDWEEYEMHREALLAQLIPATPLEVILATRVVDLSWRLRRAGQDQNEAFGALYDRYTAGAQEPLEPQERGKLLGRMVLDDFEHEAVLERLQRYERRIEASFYRTLNELRRVHDQSRKAAQEVAGTLERWRQEDGEARKRRALACDWRGTGSPGPAGGTTNTPGPEVAYPPEIPAAPFTHPVPDVPEDETCKTNPIPGDAAWDGAGGAGDTEQMCKTNPILPDPEEGAAVWGEEVRSDANPYGTRQPVDSDLRQASAFDTRPDAPVMPLS